MFPKVQEDSGSLRKTGALLTMTHQTRGSKISNYERKFLFRMFEKWKVASFKKITATFILTLQNHASRCWTDRRWGFISFEVSVHLSTTETPKKARQKLPILRISLWNSKIRQKSTVANLAIEGPPAYVPIFPLSNHATCVSLRHQHQKLFGFRRPLLFSFGTM